MSAGGVSFVSLPRIAVIAGHTFTQLVRMKVFYFLGIFAVILLGLQLVEMPYVAGAGGGGEQDIRLLKSAGFFAMNVFSFVMALSATALLLPKDVEDRTLYTILCKPVPRLDYLLGKFFGVMFLIFVSLVVMDVLFCLVLQHRVDGVAEMQRVALERMGRGDDFVNGRLAETYDLGVTWNLQAGVLAVFCKAAVVASVALLVSTFSTSTIFTMIITVIVVLIGLIQADAREYFLLQQRVSGASGMGEVTRWIALLFPDFQLLGMEDGVIDGRVVPAGVVGRVGLATFLYCSIYVVLGWFVFRRKEF